MKALVLIVVCLIGCMLSHQYIFAYTSVVEAVPVQYEVVHVTDDPMVERVILGELEGYPEMFEIRSDTDFTLTVELRSVSQTLVSPEFGAIIIRQKEPRGVEEVARLRPTEADWVRVVDAKTGLPYLAGPLWSEPAASGTYRIEVSSPENSGKYALVIGSQSDANGYFENLRNVKETYSFHAVSQLRMFNSPYIHYPIGILVLLGLFFSTWWWQRKTKRHA